ncbi:MAG: CAP domain-containing protein [Pirellulales bacterium]
MQKFVRPRVVGIRLALALAATFAAAATAQANEFPLHRAERNVVDRTNAQRARFGLAPLKMSKRLVNQARRHAQWMAKSGNFRHGNDGVAENIAWGQSSSDDAVGDWMNSSGHRANILGGYTHMGASWARGSDGRLYWVQQFSSGEKDDVEAEGEAGMENAS